MATQPQTKKTQPQHNGNKTKTKKLVDNITDLGGKNHIYDYSDNRKQIISTIDFSSDILEYLIRNQKFEIIEPRLPRKTYPYYSLGIKDDGTGNKSNLPLLEYSVSHHRNIKNIGSSYNIFCLNNVDISFNTFLMKVLPIFFISFILKIKFLS